MTILITFVPLLIIIGILIVFVSSRRNFTLLGWINGKRASLILSVYMVILLIAAGVYMFGPEPNASERDEETSEHRLRDMQGDIFDIAQGEQSIDMLEDYIKDQETISYEPNELTIQVSSHRYLSSFIIIDQTGDQAQSLEVTYYETPTYASGINVNDRLKHLSYRFEDDTLILEEPYRQQKVTIINLTSEFTFDQFIKADEFPSDSMMDPEQNEIQINHDVLYIQAPKDLTIDLGSYEDDIYIIE